MPVITLPDGSKREFDQPVTLMQVAEDIGPGLAKATVCGRINGELVDACELIDHCQTDHKGRPRAVFFCPLITHTVYSIQ